MTILIKGGGELASGVAHRLVCSHFKVCLTEISHPQAVRRGVAFSEAVYEGEKEVEGVQDTFLLHLKHGGGLVSSNFPIPMIPETDFKGTIIQFEVNLTPSAVESTACKITSC